MSFLHDVFLLLDYSVITYLTQNNFDGYRVDIVFDEEKNSIFEPTYEGAGRINRI